MSPRSPILALLLGLPAAYLTGESAERSTLSLRIDDLERRVESLEAPNRSMDRTTPNGADLSASDLPGVDRLASFEDQVLRTEQLVESFFELDRRGKALEERGWRALVYATTADAYISAVDFAFTDSPGAASHSRDVASQEISKIAERALNAPSAHESIFSGIEARVSFWSPSSSDKLFKAWALKHGANLKDSLESGRRALREHRHTAIDSLPSLRSRWIEGN